MTRGQFSVGDGYARYQGPAPDGTFHRHAAFQIVLAPPSAAPSSQSQPLTPPASTIGPLTPQLAPPRHTHDPQTPQLAPSPHDPLAPLLVLATQTQDPQAAPLGLATQARDPQAAHFGPAVSTHTAAPPNVAADSARARQLSGRSARTLPAEVGVVDESGTEHYGAALIVPPMVLHRLLPAPDLVTFYIEPHSALADDLREHYRDGIIAASGLHDLSEIDKGHSRTLDPRLRQAMHLLQDRNLLMPKLAAEVGLSPQRLRALARQQLGMPLPRWRVWSELRRAAEALRAGQCPAEAALTAGFADQAHLTRRMREMVGLTPAAVLPVLRNHPAP